VPILREWEIDDRINYFITDNEAANGTAIDHVLSAIDPDYKRPTDLGAGYGAFHTPLTKPFCLAKIQRFSKQLFMEPS
jgi:hypothetical protein